MDWCVECDSPQPIVEEGVETAGQLETERDYYVIRLGCGHEIANPVTRSMHHRI